MNRDLIAQVKRYGALFWEAAGTKDKLLILAYIFCSPIRVCCKRLGFKPSRRYLARLTIRNRDGLFDCGRSYISSRMVTTDSERELREQFRIDHGVFIDVGAHIGIGRIDLIKVDVEAAEADVMRGSTSLLKRHRPKIVFEAYDALCLRHVMEILSPLGYEVRNISGKNYLAFSA
jgi:hypothetical protein